MLVGVLKIDIRDLRAIELRVLSDEEAKVIFGRMREEYKRLVKTFVMVFGIIALSLLALTAAMMFIPDKRTGLPHPVFGLVSGAVFAVVFIIIGIVVWFTKYAWVKAEYDDILEDNYPQLYDEYKL